MALEAGGSSRGRDGSAMRVDISSAVAEVGVRARRLRGLRERGSMEVGTDSGIGSDMVDSVRRKV